MVKTSLATLLAQRPDQHEALKASKLFEFDADTIRMAHELSMHDWREWLPLARPPFQNMWFEWSPEEYLGPLEAPDQRVTRVGALISAGDINVAWAEDDDQEQARRAGFIIGMDPGEDRIMGGRKAHLTMWFQAKHIAYPVPYTLILDPAEVEIAPGYLRKAWGEPYTDKYGAPPVPVVCPHFFFTKAGKRGLKEAIDCFVGAPRAALAALALINLEHERQAYPESYRVGRAIGKGGNTIPAYKPQTIHLRPDAIRYVLERAEREPTGIKHRLHDVRGHWRQLKGRKVWVREHERGDASKGPKLVRSYTVESAPPVLPDPSRDRNP